MKKMPKILLMNIKIIKNNFFFKLYNLKNYYILKNYLSQKKFLFKGKLFLKIQFLTIFKK